MRSIMVRKAGRFEGRYLRRSVVDSGMLKGTPFVVIQLDDGEAISFAVSVPLKGIVEAIDRALHDAAVGDSVRVAIEVYDTESDPREPLRMSWAVSYYPKGARPPVWEWARFHGSVR